MFFHQPLFILLLFLTFVAYIHASNSERRQFVLLGGSFLFFVYTGWSFVVFSAMLVFNYFAAKHISASRSKPFLTFTIIVNLLNLAFFKYTLFLLSSINGIGPVFSQTMLDAASHIFLPVGISFYTFQIIAYQVDLYRGAAPMAENFFRFSLFIGFFGQLIAGPIMRASEFLPQLKRLSAPTAENMQKAFFYFFLGLMKKAIFADQLSVTVDQLYMMGTTNTVDAWLAGIFFGFQIYFDFSGYCDMALGIGHFFGLNLTENFRTPYLAKGASEFWRRWNITLSSWIRDYLYIPLGGNRVSFLNKARNLVVVMAIMGLWHGASWNFVFWGLGHGLWLVVSGVLLQRVFRGRIGGAIAVVVNFFVVCMLWVFFRAETFENAKTILSAMFTLNSGLMPAIMASKIKIVRVLILFAFHYGEEKMRSNLDRLLLWYARVPAPVKGVVYAALIVAICLWRKNLNVPFIYFKF